MRAKITHVECEASSIKYEVGNDMVHVIAVSRVSKTKSFNGYQNCVVLFPLEGGAGQFGIIWELVNRTYLLTALVLWITQYTTQKTRNTKE